MSDGVAKKLDQDIFLILLGRVASIPTLFDAYVFLFPPGVNIWALFIIKCCGLPVLTSLHYLL